MTLAEMLALFPDNTSGDISPEDARDVITALYGQNLAYLGADDSGTISFIALDDNYYRKITLEESGMLLSAGAYLKGTVDNVPGVPSFAIMTDVAGEPGLMTAVTPSFGGSFLLNTTDDTPRWIDFPLGKYLPAGDYWIQMFEPDASSIELGREVDGGTGVSGISATAASWLVEAGGLGDAFVADDDEYLLRVLFMPASLA